MIRGTGENEVVAGIGNTSPVKEYLQRQRESTERCLSILTRCRSRDEIIEGFGQIAALLRQSNDPLAQAAEMASMGCKTLPEEHVLRLRDDFIKQCRAFLSATEQGLKDL